MERTQNTESDIINETVNVIFKNYPNKTCLLLQVLSLNLRILNSLLKDWNRARMSAHCATINKISLELSETMLSPNIIPTLSHMTASSVTKSLAQIAHIKFTKTDITNDV